MSKSFYLMIEVFKTNIEDPFRAEWLISKIHGTFYHYKANFDLDDCDNILRVACSRGLVESQHLICFLEKFGCKAEVLGDEIQLSSEPGKMLTELFVIPR